MFYITKKTSETGLKFEQILKDKKKAIKAQKQISKKYGFEKYRGAYWQVWGGISSCVDFKEAPDKKIWGKGAETGEYFPKKNSKVAKAVWQDFEDMPCVGIGQLNSCIGFDEHFYKIGFAFDNIEYFGFETSKEWGITIPKDCEEVLESKYDELFQS